MEGRCYYQQQGRHDSRHLSESNEVWLRLAWLRVAPPHCCTLGHGMTEINLKMGTMQASTKSNALGLPSDFHGKLSLTRRLYSPQNFASSAPFGLASRNARTFLCSFSGTSWGPAYFPADVITVAHSLGLAVRFLPSVLC